MKVCLVGPEQETNLSLRYLSGALQAAGHEVVLARFDGPAHLEEAARAAHDADLVGLSMAFQARAREFLALARALRERGAPLIVAGGHYASCAAEELLAHHPEIDLVVLHEGERTLVDLADGGGARADLWVVPGLVFRAEDGLHRSPPRPVETDLDTLPWPDREGPQRVMAGVPTAFLLGSRGCLGRCDYCCIQTLHRLGGGGPRLRQRSPADIAAEMAALHIRGVRQFIFHDDNFLVPSTRANLARIEALRAALAARGVEGDIALAIKCRPQEARPETLAALRRMGLIRVFLGVESASARGLASLGRGGTPREAERALATCRALGISAQFTLICFHPDATEETLASDLRFLGRHLGHPQNFCRAEIYAGTPLERRMLAEGRAFGDHLERSYTITDPLVETCSQLAAGLFLERCWAPGSLLESAIGLDHHAAVLRHFHSGRTRRLEGEIAAWCRAVNADTVGLLEELVQLARGVVGATRPGFLADFGALRRREERTRADLHATGQALQRQVDGLAGIHRPREHRAARTATALWLLGTAACGGIADPPPPAPTPAEVAVEDEWTLHQRVAGELLALEQARARMEPDEYQRRRDALLAEVEGRPLVPPAEPAPSAEEGAAQPDPPPPMPQHGVCEYAPKPMNREAEVQRWFDAALLAQAQGRPIDAIRDFQMVLARDPDRTSDLTWRAEEQIRIEKAGLAAKATPLRDRAERARAQGDDLAERAAWRDLLAIDPWDQAAPARLAEIQATLDTRAQGVFEEGKREAAAGRAEGAMERFRTVLELVPDAHAPLHQKTQLAIERLLEASQPTQDPPGPEEPVPR